jgi:2-oxo-4-hydroxy-4-carboxy-5-ureidoimidazoline decarboxylase
MTTLAQLNSHTCDEFVRIVGTAFEHSPWIAEAACAERPFASVDQLHSALCRIVQDSGKEKQLALIRAHPDLAGRFARADSLTPESTREQSGAGLDKMSPEETELLQNLNAAYREKFDFPFIICARHNRKEAILNGFQTRLNNSHEREMKTALEEIAKIAYLRLRDTLSD